MADSSPSKVESSAKAEPPAPAPAKKGGRAYLVLFGIVALGGGIYGAMQWMTAGEETTDDAQVEADVVPVSARVAGQVLHLYVKDHQAVKKGEKLVDIDPADLKARVKQAEAGLAAAKAQAAAADAQVRIVDATSRGGLSAARAHLKGTATSARGADAQVLAAKANVQRAESDAAKAETDLVRAQGLRKDEAIPQAQLDGYLSTATSARAAVQQARAQLAAAEDARREVDSTVSEAEGRVEQNAPVDAQMASAKANADLAHARVGTAEAELDLANLNLSYTTIVAPSDGVLSTLSVREGQLLQPNQQVVSVVPTATYVVANFKETQVATMREGQKVRVDIDGIPGRHLEGKVLTTSPATGARFSLLPPDNASGNFVKVVQRVPVRIGWVSVPSDIRLAAGMSADVTVYTK